MASLMADVETETEVFAVGLKDVVAANVEKYVSRYAEGKDIWTGRCLACKELMCDCNLDVGVEFEKLDYFTPTKMEPKIDPVLAMFTD